MSNRKLIFKKENLKLIKIIYNKKLEIKTCAIQREFKEIRHLNKKLSTEKGNTNKKNTFKYLIYIFFILVLN